MRAKNVENTSLLGGNFHKCQFFSGAEKEGAEKTVTKPAIRLLLSEKVHCVCKLMAFGTRKTSAIMSGL